MSTYGDRSLRALRPHTWNFIPENIESTTSKIILLSKISSGLNANISCTSS